MRLESVRQTDLPGEGSGSSSSRSPQTGPDTLARVPSAGSNRSNQEGSDSLKNRMDAIAGQRRPRLLAIPK